MSVSGTAIPELVPLHDKLQAMLPKLASFFFPPTIEDIQEINLVN